MTTQAIHSSSFISGLILLIEETTGMDIKVLGLLLLIFTVDRVARAIRTKNNGSPIGGILKIVITILEAIKLLLDQLMKDKIKKNKELKENINNKKETAKPLS